MRSIKWSGEVYRREAHGAVGRGGVLAGVERLGVGSLPGGARGR